MVMLLMVLQMAHACLCLSLSCGGQFSSLAIISHRECSQLRASRLKHRLHALISFVVKMVLYLYAKELCEDFH